MRVFLFAILVTAACGKGEEPPAPTSGSPNARPESGPKPHGAPAAATGGDAKAQALFGSMCATCHGPEGHGDGPAAANLDPKPRDYADAKWQASVTDDDIKRVIVLGGKKVGKSAMMPGNAQLENEPETLDGLVKIIRGFGHGAK